MPKTVTDLTIIGNISWITSYLLWNMLKDVLTKWALDKSCGINSITSYWG